MDKPTPLVMKNHPKPENEKPASTKDIKQPFVRKPHLTQRPFNNDNLKGLRNDLSRKMQPNYKIRRK